MKCSFEFLYYVIRAGTEYIQLHQHNCYELVYYLNGSGSTRIGQDSYLFTSGSFAVINPECPHDEAHDRDTEVLFIGFKFDGYPFQLNNGIYKDNHQNSIMNLLKKIKKEFTEKQLYYEMKLDLYVRELLIEIERINRSQLQSKGDFTYIRNYLEENYNQPVDMKVLSELSGYSYHHFRHMFKQRTGLSPINYIIRLRIEHAMQMLRQTPAPMKEISLECGFSTESQFSTLFKRFSGQSPSAFRHDSQAGS